MLQADYLPSPRSLARSRLFRDVRSSHVNASLTWFGLRAVMALGNNKSQLEQNQQRGKNPPAEPTEELGLFLLTRGSDGQQLDGGRDGRGEQRRELHRQQPEDRQDVVGLVFAAADQHIQEQRYRLLRGRLDDGADRSGKGTGRVLERVMADDGADGVQGGDDDAR